MDLISYEILQTEPLQVKESVTGTGSIIYLISVGKNRNLTSLKGNYVDLLSSTADSKVS